MTGARRPRASVAALVACALSMVAPAMAQAPGQPPEALEVAPAPGAMFRGLDKVAGAARDLPVSVGDSVTFGRLTLTLLECRYPVGNPAADGFAYVLIHDARQSAPVFRGWMIASSPALHAVDHPRFDIWLIRCTSA
ncbi:MAG: DUF2155 domain-containing protein [Alkalilacustris sp.]